MLARAMKTKHTAPALPAFLFCALALLAANLRAQEPPVERGLDKVRLEALAGTTGLCALSVAAHPDDEDGATISWLRRVAGVEVHMCLGTRGEGGQNESGPEQGAELAALRSRETETAAGILGAKVWYLNLADFGYTDNPDEALQVWNKDTAVERLVRVIRKVRPQILFTNHDPQGTDHGHHVALARVLSLAFDAAGDPTKFPEQLDPAKEGLTIWKPSKLYLRQRVPEGATLSIDVSARDPISGVSPAEVGVWALFQHATQGMEAHVAAGEKALRYFRLLKTNLPKVEKEASMLDGLEPLNLPKNHHLRPLTFAPENPELAGPLWQLRAPTYCEPALLAALRDAALNAAQQLEEFLKLPKPKDQNEFSAWLELGTRVARAGGHLQAALAEAAGMRFEATCDVPWVTPGEEASITVRIANTGTQTVTLSAWKLVSEPNWEVGVLELPKAPLAPGQNFEATVKVKAAPEAWPTLPAGKFAWLRTERRAPLRLESDLKIGTGNADDTPTAVHPPQVEVPLALAPPFEAHFNHEPVLVFLSPDIEPNALLLCRSKLVVTNYRRTPWTLNARQLDNKAFSTADSEIKQLEFTRPSEVRTQDFIFHVTAEKLAEHDLVAEVNLYEASAVFDNVQARFRRVPLKLAMPLNVGLIKTYDNATRDALHLLSQDPEFKGLNLAEVSAEDLANADLDNSFHTLILDLRATQYRPDVLANKQRLKKFMENGGVVVCLYHKDFDWNPENEAARGRGFFKGHGGGGEIAPFPITLSFDRVTDENAPVKFLEPKHPLLNKPCSLYPSDFDGWVQERGVYFPKTWGPEYHALLSSNDKGHPELKGGLLVAAVGKGAFIYTSYAWHRQLAAGVPGAYRMLANMISYIKTKDEGK